jgi:hypothetical protein
MVKIPTEYEEASSDSYPINATYAISTGQALTVYKKDNICQIPLKALKNLPYGKDVTILSPMADKYKPLVGVSVQIYDSNNSGYVTISLNLDGSLHAYSFIKNPTDLHNIGGNNIIYIAKN